MEYPIVVVLKNGEHITDLNHPLINYHHVNITNCINTLKINHEDKNTVIFVLEEANKVYAEALSGKTYTFIG